VATLTTVVGELIADRYELEELVGSGGMSSVYKAHDRLLERSVAIKILHEQYTGDDDYVERFRREARSVAQLTHPNIVTVIDRGEQDGRQFIVFEYVEGENLKELLDREGPLSPEEAIDVGVQVARGLSFAHSQGLVHRDVKPQNVLLDGDGRAKVTDFGIARSLDVEGVTITGTVMGTSNYIAPEQARGQPVDDQTDVYSLGCVLYELLAGEVPYGGENFVSVAMRHVNDPVPSVGDARPDVPPRLDDAIQRAMAKDHRERFESMAAFAAELEACRAELERGEGATLVVPPRAAPQRRRRARTPRRRRRWGVLAAVLIGVGLAALVGGLIGAYLLGRGDGSGKKSSAGAAPIHLRGVTAYDPQGDPPGEEHNDKAHLATDGNTATYWDTEHYRSFTKDGVGVVLDAGRSVQPHSLRVTTDTPGFTARIEAGDSVGGPFHAVSASRTVDGTSNFPVNGRGRYFVIWITDLGDNPSVHVNEVRAR
jgi:eukaryotic-like serine/threonine-protein kinase